MSRVCQVSGRKSGWGNKIARRGLAKAKGGVGLKTTGITRRRFKPNLHWKRIWVAELGRFVRVRLSAHAMRSVNKLGAYRVLLDAGILKPAKKGEKVGRQKIA